jgi:leucyl aminopeptidase
MNFSVTTSSALSQKQPAAVLFAFEKERLDGPAAFKNLLRQVGPKEFRGAERQLFLLHCGRANSAATHSTGRSRQASQIHRRSHAPGNGAWRPRNSATWASSGRQCRSGAMWMPLVHAIVEAAILATYRFRQFKADEDGDATTLKTLTLCLPKAAELKAARKVVAEAQVIAEATNYARDIGNLPGNIVTPRVMADYARKLADESGLVCTVLARKELEKGGFGGLLAVGGGSANEPHLIVLEYNGSNRRRAHRARRAKPSRLIPAASRSSRPTRWTR